VQVLPSYCEGQAMVNLETATCGVPSITTLQAGLPDWEEGGGLLVRPDAEALAASLTQVSHWDIEERNRRGESLRRWVIRNYSYDAIMPKWEKLYRGLCGNGDN
jgi:glycosyltransferase involved in cell wall biosynthesis